MLLRGAARWLAQIGRLLFSAVAYPMLHHGFHWQPRPDPG
jgi:hypothetical protein